ncbi:uncharacterized protein LOC109812940 [Cajanus cajan]|uniref:uncharacterized protein LOC109812940 n=1 Tax=Cajanus cajan TaxID=3821 RepID=UPI00098DCE12|nr:uncharacterized protein LOC109812940 [Cajanus cajan]
MDHEDPYTHLSTFYELIGTMGVPEEDEEAVYLQLFPFSLTGKAKTWLQAHPNQSLTRWEDVKRKFLARFFPPSRYISVKSTIATFSQGTNEPLCEAWERYKSLLRKCPNHGFDDVAQLNMFCNGLRPQTKMLLDASAGGSTMMKDSEEAITIIDALATSYYQAHHDRSQPTKREILELDTQNAILAQNKLLSQQMEELKKQMSKLQVGSSSRPQQVMRCDFCAGDHPNGHCTITEPDQEEEVNYMNNPGRQGNFSSNYNQNQDWRNNQNQYFGWKQEAGPSQRQPPQKPYQNQPSYQPDRRGTVIGRGIGDNLRENKDEQDKEKSEVELESEKEVELNKEAGKIENDKKKSEKNERRDGDVREESKKKGGKEVNRPPPMKNLPY